MEALSPPQRALLERYLENLERWNRAVNLTSRRTAGAGLQAHVDDALHLLTLHPWRGADRVIDLGSGAGFPGLPLKIARPQLRVTLVEADRKKAGFLQHTAGLLHLEDVEIVVERIETYAQRKENREAFDVATARALGPPPVVFEYALPFLRIGGVLLAPVGAVEPAAFAGVASLLGGGMPDRLATPSPGRHVLRVRKERATPPEYPRAVGVPAKRPLA
jgi:16S rRNA (guanine527-N7)-methyltransferase